jgi:putative flippase GtrA
MSTTFIKAQTSSIISTLIDFSITILFKELFNFWYLLASIVGTFAGGATNFALGRHWVFDAKGKKMHRQILKYVITWVGSMLLTTLGVFVVTHYIELSYIISKIVVAIVVGVCYNYTLQKKFVFS